MIPMFLKIKIPRQRGDILTLYVPLFIAWLILIPVLILLLPFILIAAGITWNRGFGRFFLYFYPLLFSLLWNLQGLKIDVEDKEHKIYFLFI
jgi:hypothetical protein